jgi:hypothetical protein
VFPGESSGGHGEGLPGGADGDPVEPPADGFGRSDVRGPAGEDKERGLERIVTQVEVPCHPAADPENHWAEPANEFSKRGLVPGPDEPGEELAIGLAVVGIAGN